MRTILPFWLGACLGSLLNVIVYRLPREESILFPGSHCPRCGRPIALYHNVPILGWLWLGGRCRSCRGRISLRYPIVEMVMAALAAALWLRWESNPAWAAAAALASGALLAVALIDWDTFLIPDELSLGLLAAGWIVSPFNPFFAGAQAAWYWSVLASLRGALAGFALCWATAAAGEKLFKKEAMGGGDIKLMAAVGAWTGGLGAFNCLMIGSFLGAAYGLVLIARGALKRSDPIPFGPFLSAGAVFNFFWRLPLGFPFL